MVIADPQLRVHALKGRLASLQESIIYH